MSSLFQRSHHQTANIFETVNIPTLFPRASLHTTDLLETVNVLAPNSRASQHVAVKGWSCKFPVDFNGSAPFPDVLLAINFKHPFYRNIPMLKRLFEPVFPNYLFCGPEVDKEKGHPIVVISHPKEEYSNFGFMCLVEAIRRKPGFSGYFYVNDDVVINWFHFYKLDRSKIWFPEPHKMGEYNMIGTKIVLWWLKIGSYLERCSKAFVEMESDPKFLKMNATKIYLENVGNIRICSRSFSELVYIPARVAKSFEIIAQKFYDHRVVSDVTIPMSILMLDQRKDMVDIPGVVLETFGIGGRWKLNTFDQWIHYTYKGSFLHPFKLTGDSENNLREYEKRIVIPSENVLKSKCLDVLRREGRFWR